MKKVNLSHARWQYMIVYFGFPAFFVIITIIFGLMEMNLSDVVFIALMVLALSVFGFGMSFVIGWKMLIQIQIDDGEITSYLFKKRIVSVNTNEEVFYMFFNAKEDQLSPMTHYILLSNRPIPQIKEEKLMPKMYKPSKYVLLRYNSETIPCLKIENWKCCRFHPKM